jgi:hypothetical protein
MRRTHKTTAGQSGAATTHTTDAQPVAQVAPINEIMVSLNRILQATDNPGLDSERAIISVRYEAEHALKAARGLAIG